MLAVASWLLAVPGLSCHPHSSQKEEWVYLCQCGLGLHEGSLYLQLLSLTVVSWLLAVVPGLSCQPHACVDWAYTRAHCICRCYRWQLSADTWQLPSLAVVSWLLAVPSLSCEPHSLLREGWVLFASADWAYMRAHCTCSCHHWQEWGGCHHWLLVGPAFLASSTLSRRKNGCLFGSGNWAYMGALCTCSCQHWQLPPGSWQYLVFLASPTLPGEEWVPLCQWELGLHEGSLHLQLPSLPAASWLLVVPGLSCQHRSLQREE